MGDWQVFSGGRMYTLRLQDDGVHVGDVAIGWSQLLRIDFPTSFSVSLKMTDEAAHELALEADWALGFRSTEEQRSFHMEVHNRLAAVGDSGRPATPELVRSTLAPIDDTCITTLASLPAHRIVRVLGLVSQLSATSGFTATMKGQDALHLATAELISTAARMGANAIVGVSASPFGAGGGITSAFGGDAVGVLMLGTAVVVEREAADEPTDSARRGES